MKEVEDDPRPAGCKMRPEFWFLDEANIPDVSTRRLFASRCVTKSGKIGERRIGIPVNCSRGRRTRLFTRFWLPDSSIGFRKACDLSLLFIILPNTSFPFQSKLSNRKAQKSKQSVPFICLLQRYWLLSCRLWNSISLFPSLSPSLSLLACLYSFQNTKSERKQGLERKLFFFIFSFIYSAVL